MTCAEIKDRTIDYLYGELSPGERAAFAQHLAGCGACRAEVGALEGTLSTARAAVKMTDEPPPARVRVAVLEAARAAAVGREPALAAAAAPQTQPMKARAKAQDETSGFWSWLRGPWTLSLAGAAAAIAIFVLARDAIIPKAPLEAERAPVAVSPPAPVVATPPPQPEALPPAAPPPAPEAKARPRASEERALGSKVARRPSADRGRYAPPPPRERRDEPGLIGAPADGVAGGLAGALGDVDSLKREAGRGGAGTGAGHLGGLRAESAASARKGASAGPSGESAKTVAAPAARSAPVAVSERRAPAPPPPAPAKPQYRLEEPMAAAPPAEAEADEAPARRAKKKDALSPFEEQVQKADRLFTSGRWSEAAAAYRELLRLHPQHQGAAGWKGRLRACETALSQ